jgi:hypothetical protein
MSHAPIFNRGSIPPLIVFAAETHRAKSQEAFDWSTRERDAFFLWRQAVDRHGLGSAEELKARGHWAAERAGMVAAQNIQVASAALLLAALSEAPVSGGST